MNDAINPVDFEQWANHPVTAFVRNKLTEQRNEYAKLDYSLAEYALNNPEDLNKLGLDSAMRMATVRGIELFTDFDTLYAEFFPEASEEKGGLDEGV